VTAGRSATLLAALAALSLALAASSAGRPSAETRWSQFAHVAGALDVAGPRADGRFVVASHQGLFLLGRNGAFEPFARGDGGYVPPPGEPYLVLARAQRVAGAGCSFHRDDMYALDPSATPGVVLITRAGRARRFHDFPAVSFPSTIAFDTVGRFGHRLLVTTVASGRSTLYAIDCRGRARVVARALPKVEGGAAVAPTTFGAFAGRLIAADEFIGRIYAFDRRGRIRVLARPNLARGQDLGVESVGFVPPRLTRRSGAYLADMGAPGSPTRGTDTVLRLGGAALRAAGARSGDLLVSTEASGVTVRIRCARRCTVRQIGRALDATHAEGHITFG